MNRTLIELLALNIGNPTENWDLNLGLVLIAYRSAVQSSTGFTPHFMLFGREMRLPLDVMYRPPEATYNDTITRARFARRLLTPTREHENVFNWPTKDKKTTTTVA